MQLSFAVALALAFGLLPSFTALHTASPSTDYLGPFNPLKVALPLLAYFVWKERQRVPKSIVRWFGAGAALLCVSTVIAGSRCAFPPMLIRETAVILAGGLAAVAYVLLPASNRRGVVLAWAALIYVSGAVDLIAPGATDWLYQHIFDPETRINDLPETGHRLLTGVFGRQSMAKLLAWMPWLLSYEFLFQRPARRRLVFGLAALAAVSTGAILATSQRGPFVGAVFAWLALAAHQGFRLRRKKVAYAALGGLLASLAVTLALVPRDLLEVRTRSMFGLSSPTLGYQANVANDNRDFRVRIAKLSLEVIARSPLGDACIPEKTFLDAGVFPAHSHSLILHQFRERGWLWGAFHLVLWLAALAFAWQTRSDAASALVAGVVAILGLGVVDHPWFVLNHAMLMAIFLAACLNLRPAGPAPPVPSGP